MKFPDVVVDVIILRVWKSCSLLRLVACSDHLLALHELPHGNGSKPASDRPIPPGQPDICVGCQLEDFVGERLPHIVLNFCSPIDVLRSETA
ncbi:hypothetical protein WJX77_002474 [Trebouxia sp. C0004]